MADALGSWAHLTPALNCTGSSGRLSRWPLNNYTLPLSLPYLLILLVVVFQLWRLYYYKHRLFSFQFWFLVLCMAWSFLRFVYFIFFPLWHFKCYKVAMGLGNFLFWVPYWLQFATFSFLLVFYSTVRRSVTDKMTLDRAFGVNLYVWLAINAVALLVIVLSVSLQVATIKVADVFTDVVRLFISFLYLVLSAALLYYALVISRMLHRTTSFVIPFHPKWMLRWWVFGPVSVLVCAIFLARSFYDSISVLTPASVSMTSHKWWNQLIIVSIFVCWEIVPAAAVVALFSSIPPTVLGGLRWSTPGPGDGDAPSGKLSQEERALMDPVQQSAYLLERDRTNPDYSAVPHYGSARAPGTDYSPHAHGFGGFSVTGTHSPATLRENVINS